MSAFFPCLNNDLDLNVYLLKFLRNTRKKHIHYILVDPYIVKVLNFTFNFCYSL